MKIALNIYIPKTAASDADAHLSASFLLAWPEGHPVPNRKDAVYLDDLILEVTEVGHHFSDNQDAYEMTLETVLNGPVNKDLWFESIQDAFKYSSFGPEGLILSMEKH